MTLKSVLKDGKGTSNLAEVSSAGELIVSGIGDNISKYVSITVINTPYNFYYPKSGYEFFITTLIVSGPANATINIFEADTPTSGVISRLITTFDFRINDTLVIPLPFGGFFRVNEGKFINVTTDIQPVNMTMIGYYKEVYPHEDV